MNKSWSLVWLFIKVTWIQIFQQAPRAHASLKWKETQANTIDWRVSAQWNVRDSSILGSSSTNFNSYNIYALYHVLKFVRFFFVLCWFGIFFFFQWTILSDARKLSLAVGRSSDSRGPVLSENELLLHHPTWKQHWNFSHLKSTTKKTQSACHLNFHLLFKYLGILSVIHCILNPYILQTTGGAGRALNLPISGGPPFVKHTLPQASLLVCSTWLHAKFLTAVKHAANTLWIARFTPDVFLI